MKIIAIAAADGAVASNITGVIDFFAICNTYWRAVNREAVSDLFQCIVVSVDGKDVMTSAGVAISSTAVADVGSVDALIIASAMIYEQQGYERYIGSMLPLVDFIRKCNRQNVPVGAFCSGSLILASTGLLDGRRATCSWWMADLMRLNFPAIELTLDKLVVCDNNLYTGGATTAYLSLCLRLVEDLAGEQLAAAVAKVMLVDPNRSSQIPFMTLQQLVSHKDEQIKKVQHWMQSHLTDSFSLDELAQKFALSKRTLIRRFKQAVGDTPVAYLQRLRVDQAKRLLETTSQPLDAIVAQVGYEDVSSFRKLFTELTQLSPKAYRQRFNLAYA